MRKAISLITLFIWLCTPGYNQVSINSDGSQPHPSALLDVKSATSGLHIPRMTRDQRDAIADTVAGLMIFCTDCVPGGAICINSGGAWRTMVPCFESSVSAGIHTVNPGQITWTWNPLDGAAGYKWNTLPEYGSASDIGTLTSMIENGTSCNTTYFRYLWAYNDCGVSDIATLIQTTAATAPASPVAGNHVASKNKIVWNWSSVPDATGYKLSSVNNPLDAIDVGSATTYTNAGLTCGISYMRYLWAYNGCGYSAPVVLHKSTPPCHVCGIPFADARDGQIYNTVTIGSQCWFADNLNIGVEIPVEYDQDPDNDMIEKYCYNGYLCQDAGGGLYQGLYQYNEMAYGENGGDICPDGWHVPDEDEWCQMLTFLDNTVDCSCYYRIWYCQERNGTDIGGSLKSFAYWYSPNTGATNSSGFSALPCGKWRVFPNIPPYFYKDYLGFYTEAMFWGIGGIRYQLYYESADITILNGPFWGSAYSIRCVED